MLCCLFVSDEDKGYFSQKLSQGLWLSSWDVGDLLQTLFHSQDWPAVDAYLQLLEWQGNLTEETLGCVGKSIDSKWELPVINKEALPQALLNAFNYSRKTGKYLLWGTREYL